MSEKIFLLNPCAKPRMTQRDRWEPSQRVRNYWRFKDEIRRQLKGFVMPEHDYHIFFIIEMPGTWSKKKKDKMRGKGHQQTPDKDNLEKGFLDALLKEDKHIWDGRATKIWGDVGAIKIIY